LLGVVKLNGSEVAVSAAQAQQLLPLVQAWRAQLDPSWGITRGASGTAAATRAILTSEQLTRIQAMHLSPSDAIRWGSGCVGPWTWMTPRPWGGPPPGEEPPSPGEGPGGCLFMVPIQDNPFIEFADRVIRVLNGWAAAG
jgi:hypothetical protein